MIKFNEVTWYSRLASIILLLGLLPVLIFYIGTQYESATTENSEIPPSSTAPATNTDSDTNTNGDPATRSINPDSGNPVPVPTTTPSPAPATSSTNAYTIGKFSFQTSKNIQVTDVKGSGKSDPLLPYISLQKLSIPKNSQNGGVETGSYIGSKRLALNSNVSMYIDVYNKTKSFAYSSKFGELQFNPINNMYKFAGEDVSVCEQSINQSSITVGSSLMSDPTWRAKLINYPQNIVFVSQTSFEAETTEEINAIKQIENTFALQGAVAERPVCSVK